MKYQVILGKERLEPDTWDWCRRTMLELKMLWPNLRICIVPVTK